MTLSLIHGAVWNMRVFGVIESIDKWHLLDDQGCRVDRNASWICSKLILPEHANSLSQNLKDKKFFWLMFVCHFCNSISINYIKLVTLQQRSKFKLICFSLKSWCLKTWMKLFSALIVFLSCFANRKLLNACVLCARCMLLFTRNWEVHVGKHVWLRQI